MSSGIAILSLMFAIQSVAGQATGSITGMVTDAATHLPVAKVQITTRLADGDSTETTGADGSFTMKDLPQGDVKLRVALRGYRTVEATISLAAGDLLKRDFEIQRMARVTGRITDQQASGPMKQQVVRLTAVDWKPRPGSAPFAMEITSGSGEFEILGLEPGDYTLEIGPFNPVPIKWDPGDPPKPGKRYGTAPYPSTIHLSEGEQRMLNIPVLAVEAFSVTCSVEFPAGYEQVPVSITHTEGKSTIVASAGRQRAGSFRIDGLLPGMHTIAVSAGERPDRAFGELSVSISDHDVDGLRIKLIPGVNVNGEVRILEDGVSFPSSREGGPASFVLLRPMKGQAIPDRMTLEEGRFHNEGLAQGEYRLTLTGLPDGFAIVDLLAGGVSTGGRPLMLNATTDLTVVITSKPGVVTGVVRDANLAPLKGVTVALIPEYSDDPTLVRRTDSAAGGTFSFRNLAPGKYRIEGGAEVEVRAGETATIRITRK
jgi:hypothetical protein